MATYMVAYWHFILLFNLAISRVFIGKWLLRLITRVYMHGVLVHFMSAMEEILHIYQFLEGYFAHWVFPKSWKSQHIGSYFAKKNDQP